MNVEQTRRLLGALDFDRLFIEELGWSQPTLRRPLLAEVQGMLFHQRMAAQLAGVAVFVIWSAEPGLPSRALRDAVERDVAKQFRENLCIFVDREREPTQSLWVWAKRGRDADGKPKRWLREHSYFRGQPADLFISKLQALFFDLADVGEGANLNVVQVAQRVQAALDVERVTKQFFRDYQAQHAEFLSLIKGLDDERARRWYASVLLNRLMFVWFLQKKGFLDHDTKRGHGNFDYLADKLAQSRAAGADRFFREFLVALFFDAFAKPEVDRRPETRRLCGGIPYLNGGLFLEHPLELDAHKRLRIGSAITIEDRAFENLFALFARYSWSLNDTPGGQANEINPDVLGYIFERYINVVSTHSQKDLGAYYTRPEITGYLAERAIEATVLQKVNKPALPEMNLPAIEHATVPDLLARMDGQTALELLTEILPKLRILDPAVGSGAFLVAAMKVLLNLYGAIVGRAELGNDPALKHWLAHEKKAHRNIGYAIRRRIITDNLYGVDLLEGAAEIAKLRLFLALVASAQSLEDLEPLPNIDFNLLRGNSLIGLMRVDEHELAHQPQMNLLAPAYRDVVAQKNRDITSYKNAADIGLKGREMRQLRDNIDARMKSTETMLDEVLMHRFHELDVRFEEAKWDAKKGDLGKPAKRAVTVDDIEVLHPFHWGYVFDAIMQNGGRQGGFDIILANPPWEVWKPQAKEFFADYLPELGKNKTQIEEFEKDKSKLLGRDAAARKKYLDYESGFPHVNQYFRKAPEYQHQFALVDGRKVGSDLNLYKLFLERCFHLLRVNGHAGVVIPSSIYTDLGAKGLRELLFAHTRIEGLFGFENRKAIFDGVHRSFKFVVLTFEKTSPPRLRQPGESNASAPPDDLLAPQAVAASGTSLFPAAFMRHDVNELARFPDEGSLEISVDLVRRLSPESLSLMEFKSQTDIATSEKMLRFPLLGEHIEGKWNLELNREFHMTDDAKALPFRTSPGPGRLPLYEGKMIWQFDHQYAKPRYWVDEQRGRQALIGRGSDKGQPLDYQTFRLGFRDIAASTNERTLVCTVIPPAFHGNKLPAARVFESDGRRRISSAEQLFLCALWNSYVLDWMTRQRVTTTLNYFYLYQLPAPRLTAPDPRFDRIVSLAARLVCTTPEFDRLADEVGIGSHLEAARDDHERARLRAEIDGLVAHLYGLTEEEFAHILGTFPLVADPVKVAARNAYRDIAKGLLQ